MYVFHYDPTTLAYVEGTPADFCQIEHGKVIVPAWASAKPPPRHDTATHWPFFVPARDDWELRPLAAQEAAA